jgi:hypothetical protein
MNKGLNDPARAYIAKPAAADSDDAKVRFAPADNLYDAIRSDVGPNGIAGFQPLRRHYVREAVLGEINEDWFDD